MKVILTTILTIILYSCSSKQEYLIEAENFMVGGWTKDTQFMEQLGSPYLLAIGYGQPVKDAVKKMDIREGRYRIWIRSKDWIPTFHPGKFGLLLNGKFIGTFGSSGKEGWIWEDAGIHELAGNCELRLKDLTGYYGRCDAVFLTTDIESVPPTERSELNDLRSRHSVAVEKEEVSYDVVVVGGGMAGCMAAVSASRQGVKVALVQNRETLGGNASMEHMIPPVGTVKNLIKGYENLDPRETGLIEEVSTHAGQEYLTGWKSITRRLTNLVSAEPNIDLFLNTHAFDVKKKENNLSEIQTVDLKTGKQIKVKGKIFIDCTGDGIVGIKAGAEYTKGREERSKYGESKAPEIADSSTLGSSLKYWYDKDDKINSFITPEWAYQFKSPRDFPKGRLPHLSTNDRIDHQWMIELGGTADTFVDAEEIRDDLLRLIYGIWGFRKNYDDRETAAMDSMKLVWVSHVLSTRETYRLLGDYVLNENDINEQILFPDRVAYGGWGLDDHPSEGFFQKDHFNNHTHAGILFSIPFRCLYSKNINNLLMAGRNISVSHVALTGTRVMLTTSVIGQAVGTAAAMCVDRELKPRELYKECIQDLQQQLLKDGSYIIEIKNNDNEDLALKAKATASSELFPASDAINGFGRARLTSTYKNADIYRNAWMPMPTDDKKWIQLEWDGTQQINVVHVNFQSKELTPTSFDIEFFKTNHWEKACQIDNAAKNRRNVIAIPEVDTSKIRIVLTDKKCQGGVAEIRVYKENVEQLKVINRFNKANTNDGEINLPWN